MIKRSLCLVCALCVFPFTYIYATPSTHIWAPSTDIQPYGKIHVTADTYTPTTREDMNDSVIHVQQVYGLTFSLLSDKPEENFLGKLWEPLGKVMAEMGFDYKKGFGPSLDTYPWYFHFKAGVPEGAYFEGMPAFAVGIYDVGTNRNVSNNNVGYFKLAKTVKAGGFDLGRFSAGYFGGNGKLLLDQNGLRDKHGPMFAWERVISEISDRLWLCVDYQGTQSSYGALNLGFSWKFADNISMIFGYDLYNNRDLTDTVTAQLDVDF
jgi:hypothetical protein